MPVSISVKANVQDASRYIFGPLSRQINFAAARAINDVVQDCRKAVPAEMKKVFESPVPRTLNATRYTKATKDNPQAEVWISDDSGKGIAPSKYLAAEIQGGSRHHKRFERALQARGIMAPGMFAVPADAAPKDASGNVPGSFYQMMLSYLGAFSEQGYKANMTAKRRARMAKVGRSPNGYKKINGVVYFAVRARGRGQPLKPGIYAKTGTHGSNITPVFVFTHSAGYEQRLDFVGIVQKTCAATFDKHMTFRLAQAVATAR